MILSIPVYNTNETEHLEERRIEKDDPWVNKSIGELHLPKNLLIAMVIREDESIIPDGKTILLEDDIVVMFQ